MFMLVNPGTTFLPKERVNPGHVKFFKMAITVSLWTLLPFYCVEEECHCCPHHQQVHH